MRGRGSAITCVIIKNTKRDRDRKLRVSEIDKVYGGCLVRLTLSHSLQDI